MCPESEYTGYVSAVTWRHAILQRRFAQIIRYFYIQFDDRIVITNSKRFDSRFNNQTERKIIYL